MYRDILTLCLIQCVICEVLAMQSYHYTMKNSLTNTPSVYSNTNSHYDKSPQVYSSYNHNIYDPYSVTESVNFKSIEKIHDSPYHEEYVNYYPGISDAVLPHTPMSMSKHKLNYELSRSRAAADYEAKYIPSKTNSEIMYERLKTSLNYEPPAEVIAGYDTGNDFHVDEDDVRSSSRSLYDSYWPYAYHNMYDYEHKKFDPIDNKVKDKRNTNGQISDVIPVHEDVSDEVYNSYSPPLLTTPRDAKEISTDNPNGGNGPFFSFVLNDYFDKTNNEDPLEFKGLEWGNEFDNIKTLQDVNLRKDRHSPNYYYPGRSHKSVHNDETKSLEDSSTKRGYTTSHQNDNLSKGSTSDSNYEKSYDTNGAKSQGSKDYLDNFLNKFGSEDHKKDSSYSIKTEQDKGEKKNGFKRVYHKDEFQENNEFFDNSKTTFKNEEKGSSNAHLGGTEGLLKSHSEMATSDGSQSYSDSGNSKGSDSSKHLTDLNKSVGLDDQFHKYRDVAKKAAISNNEYSDY